MTHSATFVATRRKVAVGAAAGWPPLAAFVSMITRCKMLIETTRLIIRDFTEHDAEALYEIKYDEQVLKYNPTFIKRDTTMADIKEMISFWQGVRQNEIYEKGIHYAICLKDVGTVIGAITVNFLDYLYELQIVLRILTQ